MASSDIEKSFIFQRRIAAQPEGDVASADGALFRVRIIGEAPPPEQRQREPSLVGCEGAAVDRGDLRAMHELPADLKR